MKKFKIKCDDLVVVTAGKHKGKTGKVLQILRERDRVLVEKVNLVTRHVKPRGDQPGGTVEKEASLHISNVALFNAEEGRAVKIGWKFIEDGDTRRKVRFDKKTGAIIDQA
ncbi:MAG: 50S ribosomal protein L24 [Myxococcota bacterium]|nr:50S ribosomal protein L24 [Myxococcota bacterium]